VIFRAAGLTDWAESGGIWPSGGEIPRIRAEFGESAAIRPGLAARGGGRAGAD